ILPMRFELRQEAQNCADKCRTFIAATGAITADTPARFRRCVNNRDLQGATMVLDSDGGSVLGAIALGRQIRTLKMNTTVGRLKDVGAGKADVPLANFTPLADCESMCAFVLLAGVQRFVAPDARVMV